MASGTGIKAELLDELLKGQDPKTLFEQAGLLDELKKALAERALNAELDHHLEQDAEQAAGNHRNGSSSKTMLTDSGKLTLSIPRDRQSRLNRNSLPNISGASPASTTRTSRSTRAA